MKKLFLILNSDRTKERGERSIAEPIKKLVQETVIKSMEKMKRENDEIREINNSSKVHHVKLR